jgi:hypothetical protein
MTAVVDCPELTFRLAEPIEVPTPSPLLRLPIVTPRTSTRLLLAHTHLMTLLICCFYGLRLM